jgi:hypothetical protein
MRTEQMANKIKNQDFFQRNLFPRMFGWFLIRLVDREFECSTLEDVEGLCPRRQVLMPVMINITILNRYGQIDRLLQAIKH